MSEGPDEAVQALREADAREGGLDLKRRRALLTRLETELIARQERIVRAVDADFGRRSRHETLLGEVLVVVRAIRHARPRLAWWARRRRVPVGAPFWPGRAWLVPQPLGIVGVMAPWNYPVQLALSPIVGALGAGNRVALKPSEATPRTADELAGLVEAALGPDIARTVLGGPDVARAFARQPFDHLVFTGSTATGRDVMRAAAESLTPLTLELGGRCPAIVLPDADIDRAAETIVMGKGLNAGQTCIAPDHVLAVGAAAGTLPAGLARARDKLYPGGLPTAVLPGAQAERVEGLLADPRVASAAGGPHLMPLEMPGSGPTRRLFGPVLPLAAVATLRAALDTVRATPSPARDLPVHERRRGRGTGLGGDALGRARRQRRGRPGGDRGAPLRRGRRLRVRALPRPGGLQHVLEPARAGQAGALEPRRLADPPYGEGLDVLARRLIARNPFAP